MFSATFLSFELMKRDAAVLLRKCFAETGVMMVLGESRKQSFVSKIFLHMGLSIVTTFFFATSFPYPYKIVALQYVVKQVNDC